MSLSRILLSTIAGVSSVAIGSAALAEAPAACPMALLFAQDTAAVGLGRISATPKVRLQADSAGCPGDSPRCRTKAYLVSGDQVVTGRTRAGWTCVFFPNDRGGAEGWVRTAGVAAIPVAPARSQATAGQWRRDEDASISMIAERANLVVAGDALWNTAVPGQVHVGELSGLARPAGVGFRLGGADEYDCRATLRLLGPYLAVADNAHCGGANVTFTGVYRRGPPAPRP
jgi:hypothetical protein